MTLGRIHTFVMAGVMAAPVASLADGPRKDSGVKHEMKANRKGDKGHSLRGKIGFQKEGKRGQNRKESSMRFGKDRDGKMRMHAHKSRMHKERRTA